MDRRSFLKAGASAAVFPAVPSVGPAPARAATEKVMRLAMTLGDIPLTSGQPSQGAEGIRFIGFALYDAMFADGNHQLLERLGGLTLPRDPRAAVKKYMATGV